MFHYKVHSMNFTGMSSSLHLFDIDLNTIIPLDSTYAIYRERKCEIKCSIDIRYDSWIESETNRNESNLSIIYRYLSDLPSFCSAGSMDCCCSSWTCCCIMAFFSISFASLSIFPEFTLLFLRWWGVSLRCSFKGLL